MVFAQLAGDVCIFTMPLLGVLCAKVLLLNTLAKTVGLQVPCTNYASQLVMLARGMVVGLAAGKGDEEECHFASVHVLAGEAPFWRAFANPRLSCPRNSIIMSS